MSPLAEDASTLITKYLECSVEDSLSQVKSLGLDEEGATASNSNDELSEGASLLFCAFVLLLH